MAVRASLGRGFARLSHVVRIRGGVRAGRTVERAHTGRHDTPEARPEAPAAAAAAAASSAARSASGGTATTSATPCSPATSPWSRDAADSACACQASSHPPPQEAQAEAENREREHFAQAAGRSASRCVPAADPRQARRGRVELASGRGARSRLYVGRFAPALRPRVDAVPSPAETLQGGGLRPA